MEKARFNTRVRWFKLPRIRLLSRSRSVVKKKYTPIAARSLKDTKTLHLLTWLSSLALFGFIAGFFVIIAVVAYFSRDLPNPNQLLNRSDELSTKILDRNGEPIYQVFGEKNRSLIGLEEINSNLRDATVAVEDASFYIHGGFDLRGMARAVRNTLTGQGLQGGSTLTQQVVKNALLTQDRTVTRKVKEFILAMQLESKYTKDEILQMYLNETPYGGQNYGVLTASRAYFNKHPSELSLAESAYMAGLPQRPSAYSYYSSNPQLGLDRKNYVLYLMRNNGWVDANGNRAFISEDEYQAALSEELAFNPAPVEIKAPHFVFFVRELLFEMYGEEMVEQGGLIVTTTLDLPTQQMAERVVREEVANLGGYNVGNGALVAMEPKSSGILAMVGSKNFFGKSEPEGCVSGITGQNSCVFEPQLNVATALRQPGSSIKPITYATMLEQGYSAAFPFLDVQTSFEGSAPDKPYIPVNYDGLFRGPMSLRKSLGNSLNIPAVKALKIAGIDNMIDQSEKMGITTFKDRSRFGLALTLGGGETKLLEMTNAFGVFANGGRYNKYNPILEVKTAGGQTLYSWKQADGSRALSAETAFLISDILSDDGARSSAFGAGSLLNIPGRRVAVKTGTTDDKRDNYAIGYTPSVVAGAWVGNNNNEAMNPAVSSGITGATPIWRKFMFEYLRDKPTEDFVAPETAHKVEVDSLTGMLPFEDFPRRFEWFKKGTEPTSPGTWYKRLEICRNDGKLANDSCRDVGRTRVQTYIDIRAELPEWQQYVDAWIGENYSGDDKYFPPKSQSGLKFDDDGNIDRNTNPIVTITDVEDGGRVPLEFRLKVEVSTPNSVRRVSIYQDGKKITDDSSDPYGYNFKFLPAQAGEYKFKAVAEDDRGNKGESEIKLRVGKT